LGEGEMKLASGKHYELPVVFATYSLTLTPNYPKVDGKDVLGYCHYEPRIIKVRYHSSNVELVRATVWHEFFHELASDEALVDGLANAVMRVRLTLPDL
jgi:hypothetical protein